jgi:hypothetical protein
MKDLEYILSHLPKGKAAGKDQIFNEIWREAPPVIRQLLLDAVNVALAQGCPDSWKPGVISFLSKGLEMTKVGNLRPIALLETVYKLLTLVVTKRVTIIAERNGLLSPCQEGFRKHRGTLHQIEELQRRIALAKSNK